MTVALHNNLTILWLKLILSDFRLFFPYAKISKQKTEKVKSLGLGKLTKRSLQKIILITRSELRGSRKGVDEVGEY